MDKKDNQKRIITIAAICGVTIFGVIGVIVANNTNKGTTENTSISTPDEQQKAYDVLAKQVIGKIEAYYDQHGNYPDSLSDIYADDVGLPDVVFNGLDTGYTFAYTKADGEKYLHCSDNLKEVFSQCRELSD